MRTKNPLRRLLVAFGVASMITTGASMAEAAPPPLSVSLASGNTKHDLLGQASPKALQEINAIFNAQLEKTASTRKAPVFIVDMIKPAAEREKDVKTFLRDKAAVADKPANQFLQEMLDTKKLVFAKTPIAALGKGGNGDPFCVIFGIEKDSEFPLFEALRMQAHEYEHCNDPFYLEKAHDIQNYDGNAMRQEARADASSLILLAKNGAATAHEFNVFYAVYTGKYGISKSEALPVNSYHSFEALAEAARTIDLPKQTNFNGTLEGFEEASRLAEDIVAKTGYTKNENAVRHLIEDGWSKAYQEGFKGKPLTYKKWSLKYDKLPEIERVANSVAWAENKRDTPFPDWKKPDYVKAYAQMLIYEQENPDDPHFKAVAEGYREAASRYNTDIFPQHTIHRLEEDKAWAKKVAAGEAWNNGTVYNFSSVRPSASPSS